MQNNTYNSPIRWGIIGCGDVTEIKSGPPFQLTEGFELIAVMRRSFDKVKDYALRHGVEKYTTDADEIIEDEEIDAIYIATPPDSHMDYALKVAKAKKICCIEKPLAPNYAQSLAIYDAFQANSVPVFTAYYRRSLPRFEKVNSWIQNNEIGDIRHISWQLYKSPSEIDLSQKPNWRTDSVTAPGGYFDDLASHGLDLFTYYLGNIKEVHGISLNQQNLYSAKDAVTACWLHENNISGSGSWNFGVKDNIDRVELFGTHGKIEFSLFEDNPIVLQNSERTETLTIDHPKHVHQYHVENMARSLFEFNYMHPSTAATGLHTSWVMDKILGHI